MQQNWRQKKEKQVNIKLLNVNLLKCFPLKTDHTGLNCKVRDINKS